MTFEVELPWPPRDLSPNARSQWARIRATREYRYNCGVTLVDTRNRRPPLNMEPPYRISFTFVPPDRHARDLDNLLASCKALIDAFVDAKLLPDDSSNYLQGISVQMASASKKSVVQVQLSGAVSVK